MKKIFKKTALKALLVAGTVLLTCCGNNSEKEEENDISWGYRLLEAAGRKRGFLISGGEVDFDRCCNTLLDEFRGGKIGRITLDRLDNE